MSSLREYQRELQAAILVEDVPAAPSPEQQLAIYRHAYRARLAGVLRQNYPVLAQQLGNDEFARVAGEYARTRPSHHFSIRWHGAELSHSLSSVPMQELARMEWALGMAFDAADREPLDVQALADVTVDDWAQLPLALHPSVNVLDIQWAIEPLWESVRSSGAPVSAAPEAHVHTLFVWRKDLQAHWRIATVEEGRALRALGLYGTLGAACEAIGEQSATAVGEWFAGWVREQMLVVDAGP